jgi:hypothetical protein
MSGEWDAVLLYLLLPELRDRATAAANEPHPRSRAPLFAADRSHNSPRLVKQSVGSLGYTFVELGQQTLRFGVFRSQG